MQNMIKGMLDQGIVEPAEGTWSSPIVLAKKKDGSYRFCVDDTLISRGVVRCSAAKLVEAAGCWFGEAVAVLLLWGNSGLENLAQGWFQMT